eukprot:scaffold25006_cov64-Phaeocystis_antarctica.AAC.5
MATPASMERPRPKVAAEYGEGSGAACCCWTPAPLRLLPDEPGRAWKSDLPPEAAVAAAAFMSTPEAPLRMAFSMPTPTPASRHSPVTTSGESRPAVPSSLTKRSSSSGVCAARCSSCTSIICTRGVCSCAVGDDTTMASLTLSTRSELLSTERPRHSTLSEPSTLVSSPLAELDGRGGGEGGKGLDSGGREEGMTGARYRAGAGELAVGGGGEHRGAFGFWQARPTRLTAFTGVETQCIALAAEDHNKHAEFRCARDSG